jgi:signal transduction histidine kinase
MLREVDLPELQHIQARRRQLFGLLLLVFMMAAAGIVLFSSASEILFDRQLQILDFGVLRVSFVALAVAFALYVWEKERAVVRVERALIEERVLSVALANRLRELTAISRAGRAVASSLSPEDVLALILESAQELLGATEGSVMLMEEDKRTLRIAAAVGLTEEARRQVIPLGEGVAGWVAEFREPVILRGDVADPRFRRFIPKDRSVRTAMSAPLYARAEPVGVLNVSISEGHREYTEHDLRALVVFADHAAIAIANARLFEREREASARLEEMDARRRELLAVITHELKTPLTSILGYARLLRELGAGATMDQAREFNQVIERQCERMLEMVEQLIMASSLEHGVPTLARQRLDLGRLIEESVAAFRTVLDGRDVRISIPEAPVDVYGDRSAIEHVLANLLDNAVKYSPRGDIELAVEASPGEVRVAIRDHGPGIPPDVLPEAFDRYRRADGPGDGGSVGLGLFIVRSLIQGHGGRVWAESPPGGGTRITFTLPVRRRSR